MCVPRGRTDGVTGQMGVRASRRAAGIPCSASLNTEGNIIWEFGQLALSKIKASTKCHAAECSSHKVVESNARIRGPRRGTHGIPWRTGAQPIVVDWSLDLRLC